ncbi:MAG: permease-like cell division protein FtsX [Acidiferrobacterales bacterium]|nr:permease-like cell division protein FtsX [Acidiferrobacterales bacterium]
MVKVWFARHLQVFFETLGRLWQTPVASMMTTLVIAIAIALPLVLYQIVTSVDRLSADWQGAPQISVFLKTQTENGPIDPIESGQRLLQNPMVEDVQYVSPEQGLEEFSEMSGFQAAIEALPENPLPPLLIVFPATGEDNMASSQLADQLASLPFVDTAVYDQQWLYRLTAMVNVVKRAVVVLAFLMGAGILLVISNTVRLGITNRASEIEIIDQVGGTRTFIRRPFLYIGAIQCLLGTLLAWLVTGLTLYLLENPVAELATLYQSQFSIGYVSVPVVLAVTVCVTLLGVLAARITVDRYLVKLRPS